MDDVLGMGVLDGEGEGADQCGGLRGGLRPAGEVLVQAATLDELHGEVGPAVVLADLVDRDDVGVAHARRRLGLDAEAGPFLRASQGTVAEQLECHQPLRIELQRPVDYAHAASAQPRRALASCR